jgi:hypothetical protein
MHRQEPDTVREIVTALPASDVLWKVAESSVIEAVLVDERLPYSAELIEVVLPVLVVNRDGLQVREKIIDLVEIKRLDVRSSGSIRSGAA